jgi:uncharacterized membrane protein YfcA
MSIWIIGHILALGVGLSLGLIGGGGSILAVPILVYVLGLEAKVAIAMSLAIVGVVSLIGVIPHWQQGNVNLKTAISFAPPAMLGAFIGARLAAFPLVTDTLQLVSFAIIMLIASYLMIRKPKKPLGELSSPQKHHPQYPWLAITLEGLGVGIITGFVGVGGGFAIIPALVLLGEIPMKQAIGTSLLIITFNSVTGFLGYLNQVNIDWNLMFSFTTAAALGVIVGAGLSQKISGTKLQTAFGYFLIAIAIFILIKR